MKLTSFRFYRICIENVYLKFNLSVWELTQGMLHNLFKLSVSIVSRNSFFGIRVSIVKVCMKSKPKAPTQPEATDLNSANKEGAVPNWKCQRDQKRPPSIARKKRKPPRRRVAKYCGATSVLLESHPRINCRLVVHMVANGNAWYRCSN